MHAVDSLRFLAIDRFVVDIQGGAALLSTQPSLYHSSTIGISVFPDCREHGRVGVRADERGPVAVGGAREGRHRPRSRRHRQRLLGWICIYLSEYLI